MSKTDLHDPPETPLPDLKGLRVLVITRHTPLPWEDGAGRYLSETLATATEAGAHVELIWVDPPGHIRKGGRYRSPEVFHRVGHLRFSEGITLGRTTWFPLEWWLPFKARFLHVLKTLLQVLRLYPNTPAVADSTPPPEATSTSHPKYKSLPARLWDSPPTDKEITAVQRFARSFRPDIVMASFPWMMPAAEEVENAVRVSLQLDVQYERNLLLRERKRDEGASEEDLEKMTLTRDDEIKYLRNARAVLAISEDDADTLRNMAPHADIHICPILPEVEETDESSLQTSAISSQANEEVSPNPPLRCLFIGSGNPPNVDALRWLIDDIWPRVSAAHPDAQLQLIGSIGDAYRRIWPIANSHPGIIALGRVPSLAPFYRSDSLVLLPMRLGSGVNVKTVEALAYGCACVATPIALRGIAGAVNILDPQDDASAFAQRTAALLSNPTARANLRQATASLHLTARARCAQRHVWAELAKLARNKS